MAQMAAASSLRSTQVLKPRVQRLASLSPPAAAALVPKLRQSTCRHGILRAAGFSSNGALPSARVHQDDDEPFLREPIRTLILDNYDSYTYNLFQLLSVINGVVLKNDEIPIEQLWLLLYEERGFHNVVISPSPRSLAHDEDIGFGILSWSQRCSCSRACQSLSTAV